MWKDERDSWTSKQVERKLDERIKEVLLKFAYKDLPPIQDQIDLVGRETEIIPGVCAVRVPGHTPGHIVLAISSGGKQLLCISDAVHTHRFHRYLLSS